MEWAGSHQKIVWASAVFGNGGLSPIKPPISMRRLRHVVACVARNLWRSVAPGVEHAVGVEKGAPLLGLLGPKKMVEAFRCGLMSPPNQGLGESVSAGQGAGTGPSLEAASAGQGEQLPPF